MSVVLVAPMPEFFPELNHESNLVEIKVKKDAEQSSWSRDCNDNPLLEVKVDLKDENSEEPYYEITINACVYIREGDIQTKLHNKITDAINNVNSLLKAQQEIQHIWTADAKNTELGENIVQACSLALRALYPELIDVYNILKSQKNMFDSVKLGGYLAGHGIYSVSDLKGAPMIPIYGCFNSDGEIKFERVAAERVEDGVAIGMEWLEKKPEHSNTGVLVYDGRLNLETGTTDAILVKICGYGDHETMSMELGIPYKPKSFLKKFKVDLPVIFDIQNFSNEWLEDFIDAFEEGIVSHEQGAKIWSKK